MTLAPRLFSNHRRQLLWLALLLLGLAAALFGQTYGFGIVYFDDDHYILDNRYVQAGLTWEGVHWAFTSFYLSNWHPLTWLSYMLDVELFGANLGAAHLNNVLLHWLNSLLVYELLRRWSGHGIAAAVCAAVFLVHPLHVESVAWLAERKDLLCALFYLAGLLVYDNYRYRPGPARYLLGLLLFAAALLSKPMAVTFPCLLLVLDYFHYRHKAADAPASPSLHLQRSVLEKLPFFAVMVASGLVTLLAQQEGGSVASVESLGLQERLLNAVLSYLVYLRQSLLPLGLAAFYPLPQPVTLLGTGLTAMLLLGWGLASLLMFTSRPLVAAGLCWYLGTLVPVIGLVQVGAQAHADRYMYLPSVGILLAICALAPRRGSARFPLFAALSALLVLFYSGLGFWQVGYWENRHSLFSRVLQVHGPTWRAHFHLAADYIQRGMYPQAELHARESLQLDPTGARSLQLLGDIALHQGNFARAIPFYREAIALDEPSSDLMNNLGIALAETGEPEQAREAFQRAFELDPSSVAASRNLRNTP